MKKKYFTCILVFVVFIISAQSIAPQVINSAGSHRALGGTGITITDNVGEPFIQTVSSTNFLITQGFLQPDLVGSVKPSDSFIKSDVSCKDKNDGYISVSVSNILPTYTVTYYWQPSSICPSNNCSYIDSLKAGIYSYKIHISIPTATGGVTIDSTCIPKRTIIIEDSNEPCKVKTFNAITPNGDGTNDGFFIDNIEEFPKNRVTIYNRWGQQIADIDGYDNVTKYWPYKDETSKLISTTYFYIIVLGDGSAPIKGWVEVLKD